MRCCAQVLAFVVFSSTAGAAEAPSTIVVAEGRDGAAVRARVVKACGKAARVIDDKTAAPALAAEGIRGELLAAGAVAAPTLEKLVAAGKRAGATAIVLARGVQQAKRPALRLVVVAVASGVAVADATVPLGRMVEVKRRKPEWREDATELEKTLRTAFDAAVWAASQPVAPVAVAPAPAPIAPEPAETKVAASVDAPSRTGELAQVFVGLREGDRSFGYGAGTGLPLRTYSPRAVGTPGVAIEARVHPLGLVSSNPWLRDLGLEGGWERAMGLTAKTTDSSVSYSVTSQSWRLLARERFTGESWEVAASMGYEQVDFSFAGAPAASELPAAAYRLLRFGGEGSMVVGPVRALARLAYLMPLAIGTALDRFFEPSWGVDVSAGAAYPLVGGLEAVGLGRYTRVVSKGYAAGNAVDTLYSLQVGVGYRL